MTHPSHHKKPFGAVNRYGDGSYEAALIHGGPGDVGSLAPFARVLHHKTGISLLEPLQSQYSLTALIQELHWQLQEGGTRPITLIGHSFGAWLAFFYAAKHPTFVKQIILIGCPPLTDEFVFKITERRLARFTPAERTAFHRLTQHMENQEDMKVLQALINKSDDYARDEAFSAALSRLVPDHKMYEAVWPKAAALRNSGALLDIIGKVQCPIHFLHGLYDPHPIEGITVPLSQRNLSYQLDPLPRCGHSPFYERAASQEFYPLLESMLN